MRENAEEEEWWEEVCVEIPPFAWLVAIYLSAMLCSCFCAFWEVSVGSIFDLWMGAASVWRFLFFFLPISLDLSFCCEFESFLLRRRSEGIDMARMGVMTGKWRVLVHGMKRLEGHQMHL